MKYKGLNEDRIFHSNQVAEKCYFLAKKDFNFDEDKARKAWLMGYIHDIGYRFNSDNHGDICYNMLVDMIDESDDSNSMLLAIKNHGDPENIQYWTDWDKILNNADMTTSKDGYDISFKERLKDIKQRYGKESKQYINSKKIIKEL